MKAKEEVTAVEIFMWWLDLDLGCKEWLRENLHRHGRKFTPKETLKLVAGTDSVEVGPYVSYLRAKYSEIYAIP